VDIRSKFHGSDIFARLTLPHSPCQEKMIIPRSMFKGRWLFLWKCQGNWRWSLPWTWLLVKFKYLGSGMFARLMLSWTSLTAKSKCNGRALLTAKSKYLGPDMLFVKHSLPQTWLIVKPKYFGPAMFAKSTLSWTSLTAKSKYLRSGISFLGMSIENSHSLGYFREGCAFSCAC
jgi:hypothetical protein